MRCSRAHTHKNGTVLPIVSSPYHLEVSATTGGRRAVQDLIKDTAQTRPIDARTPFKVIVVHEADRLSKEAQQALRRTMEKTAGACRLILCCDEVSRLIEPIRSRACHIRVQAPSDAVIEETMRTVAQKEKFEFPPAFGKKVVELADGNMRKALLILESEHVKGAFTNPTLPDWENAVRSIVTEIVTKQGSDQQKLLNCRMLLYELLAHCIPPHVILLTLLNEIRLAVDGTVATDAAIWAAVYVFSFYLLRIFSFVYLLLFFHQKRIVFPFYQHIIFVNQLFDRYITINSF